MFGGPSEEGFDFAMLRRMRQICGTMTAPPSFRELVDPTCVEEVDLDAAQCINLSDRVDPFSRTSRRAFVATGLAEMRPVRPHRVFFASTKMSASFRRESKPRVRFPQASNETAFEPQ